MAAVTSGMVEVCVFAFTDRGPEYLMLRRSPGETVYPGLWQFVTGAVEGEEPAHRAALRELSEETGFHPEGFWVVPRVNAFYDPSRDSIHLTPVFAAQVPPSAIPKLSAEHSEYRWCDRSAAAGLLAWPEQRETLRILHESIVMGGASAGLSRIL